TPPAALPRAASHTLERELASVEGGRAWLRRLLVVVVLAAIGGGVAYWRVKTRPPPPAKYVLAPTSRGDVSEAGQCRGAREPVPAAGGVQPVTEVQVGAQISGRIAKVYVDFNSIVKRGDVLAEIDPTLLGATVEQNRAQAVASEANVARAQASLDASEVALQ